MNILNIQNTEQGRKLTLQLNGVIGQSWYDAEDKSVNELISSLKDFAATEKDEIHVMINSPGGNYFAGVHLHNELKASKAKIVTHNLSQAQSAASLVFCAGDERIMYPGSILMIHNPLVDPGLVNAQDMQDLIAALETVASTMKGLYMAVFKSDESDLTAMLENETIFNSQEAIENGFATSTSDEGEYKTFFNVDIKASKSKELEKYRKPVFTAATSSQIVMACHEAGLSSIACSLIDKDMTIEAVNQQISNVKNIRNICAASGVDFSAVEGSVLDTAKLMQAFATECKKTDYQIQNVVERQAAEINQDEPLV